jgi:hypothetical protein
MDRKFTALRIAAVIIKVFAWITAGCTVLGFLGCLVMGATMGSMMRNTPYGNYGQFGGGLMGVIMAFSILLYGAFMFVCLLAWSDLIMVMLAIEENTRGVKPAAPTP